MKKFQENLKTEHRQSLVPSLHFKSKNLAIPQQNRAKSAIKRSIKALISLIWPITLTIFCERF